MKKNIFILFIALFCVGLIGGIVKYNIDSNKNYYAFTLNTINEKELKKIEEIGKIEEIAENINLVIVSTSQMLSQEKEKNSNIQNVKKINDYIKVNSRRIAYDIVLKEKNKHFLREIEKMGYVIKIDDFSEEGNIFIKILLTEKQFKLLKNESLIEKIYFTYPITTD